MPSPEIVLLDDQHRHFRSSVLKARGYRVFTTQHVVEVCLHWVRGDCAALILGPHIQWNHVATLCEWITINSPEKPIILLSDRRSARWPAHIAVVPTQPVQALTEHLRTVVPLRARQRSTVEAMAMGTTDALSMSAHADD